MSVRSCSVGLKKHLKSSRTLSFVQKSLVSILFSFNAAHKAIAKTINLPESRFSWKTSRVGAACAFSMAGYSDSFIMQMGRWSSLAFLHYVRQCITAYWNRVDAISDLSILTLNDVRRLLPVIDTFPKGFPI